MGARLHILVVHDNEADFVSVRDTLAELDDTDYQADWCADFNAGLDKIRKDRHDAYLIDQRLGLDNGIGLLRAARECGNTRPFIMFTGVRDRAMDESALREGAADFLAKGGQSAAALDRAIRYSIECHRTLAEMHRAALTDPLTGLANLQHFRDCLAGAMARLQGNGQALGLLFIDLDGFKPINDRRGRSSSAACSNMLKRNVRRGDLVARIGGYEFVVVLDHVGDTVSAAGVVDNIRRSLAANPLDADGVGALVAVSNGTATHAGDDEDIDALILAADRAMYADKRRRRTAEPDSVPTCQPSLFDECQGRVA